MNTDIIYSSPTSVDICVVYCYYNPTNNPVILQNAQDLESKLKTAHIPYFNAEIIVSDGSPVLDNPSLILRTNSTLLYKESAWNQIEKIVPSKFTKICFMDVNLRYTVPYWLDSIAHMLKFYDLIQPFGSAFDTNNNHLDNKIVIGKVWGIKRSFFNKIGGFFSKSVILDNSLYNGILKTNNEYSIINNEYNDFCNILNNTHIRIVILNIFLLHDDKAVDMSDVNNILKNTSDWDSLFKLNNSNLWESTDSSINSAFNKMFKIDNITPNADIETIDLGVIPPHDVLQTPVIDESTVVVDNCAVVINKGDVMVADCPPEAPVEAPVEPAVEPPVEAPVEPAVEAPVEPAVEAPVEPAVVADTHAPVVKPLVYERPVSTKKPIIYTPDQLIKILEVKNSNINPVSRIIMQVENKSFVNPPSVKNEQARAAAAALIAKFRK